jgi:hypothetical protein
LELSLVDCRIYPASRYKLATLIVRFCMAFWFIVGLPELSPWRVPLASDGYPAGVLQ